MAKANDRIAYVLKQLKMRQADVSRRIGLSRGLLSQINSGKQPVTEKTARAFEREFGVLAEWILTGRGPYSVHDEEPTYLTGPLSESDIPVRPARALARRAYHCSYCHAELAEFARQCHRCGSLIQWLDAIPPREAPPPPDS